MKKILALLAFIGAATAALADTNYTAFSWCVTGGTTCNTDPDRWGKWPPVRAIEFGVVHNNSGYDATQAAVNRATFQAAFDYTAINQRQVVELPCGTFWTDRPLFADDPANRRTITGAANNGSGLIRLTVSSTTTWTTNDRVTVMLVGGTTEANGEHLVTVIDGTHVDLQGSTFANAYTSGGIAYNPVAFNLTMYVKGCGGPANHANAGTTIKPVANMNAPYLVVGPGNGMGVEGLTIRGTISGAACTYAYPSQSVGIGYASGNGGGSRFQLNKVGVYSARTLIALGWDNHGSLSDRTVLYDVDASGGYYGLHAQVTQAFIINLDSSSIAANYSIYNPLGLNINVRGGGYANGSASEVFSISSTSGLTAATGSYTLSTTVGSPSAAIAAGCYNAFAIRTARFGIVPLTVTSYNAGTIGLRILDSWRINHFGDLNVVTATDLQAEIQAATQLFASEKYTVFHGAGINADGVHVEGAVPLTLVDTMTGESSSRLTNIRMNMDPVASGSAACLGQGNACEAAYLNAKVHPFMNLGNSQFEFSNFFPFTTTDPILIDAWPQGGPVDYKFSQLYNTYLMTRWWTFASNDDHEQLPYNRYKGVGFFDRSYWAWRGTIGNGTAKAYYTNSDQRTPFMGFRPIPWGMPQLTPDQFTAISGALGTLGNYPVIHGGTILQVAKEGDTTTRKLVSSAHKFYSWGQDLTSINWTYKGGSHVVYMDDTTKMFPGLAIVLNFAAADHLLVVTSVTPGLGYITVTNPTPITDFIDTVTVNPGVKTTTYTGTVVKQQPYSWTSLTLAP